MQPGVQRAPLIVAPIRHPFPIEPQHVDVGILREQLLELRLHVRLDVSAEVRVAPGPRVVLRRIRRLGVRVMPIHDRVVHAEAQTLSVSGVGERLEGVAVEWRRIDHIVLRDLRVEEREAIVMLGRDDDVFHPRVLRDAHPFVRVVLHRIEGADELLVFRHGYFRSAHDPLADAGHALAAKDTGWLRVGAPVYEHPELGVAPPRHTRVALGGGLSGCYGLRWRNGCRARREGHPEYDSPNAHEHLRFSSAGKRQRIRLQPGFHHSATALHDSSSRHTLYALHRGRLRVVLRV